MKRVLYITMIIPDVKIKNAGEKTFEKYFYSVYKESEFDIRVIAPISSQNVTEPRDYMFYPMVFGADLRNNVIRGIYSVWGKVNPFDKYAGFVNRYYISQLRRIFREYKKEGYEPDTIVLEWTMMLLVVKEVRAFFPHVRIVASEHDVSYLGYQRKYEFETNPLKKIIKRLQYKNLKNRELTAIELCDLVFPHNQKDRMLLIKDGICSEKVSYIVPYYDDYYDVERSEKKRNSILFFGGMDRAENYLSVIWFIENVMPKIDIPDAKLYIVGGRPNKVLYKYACNNVIITGFVADIRPFLEDALCMVVPLLLGAGIKIKVLEGMSAGVPIITNKIGIEGIPAEAGIEYIAAESADEYIEAVQQLYMQPHRARLVGENGRRMVKYKFDIEDSCNRYKRDIL